MKIVDTMFPLNIFLEQRLIHNVDDFHYLAWHPSSWHVEGEVLPRHADWSTTRPSYMQSFIFRKGKNREKNPSSKAQLIPTIQLMDVIVPFVVVGFITSDTIM